MIDLGQREYALRQQGFIWENIATRTGCSVNTARDRARRYAIKNKLPMPSAEPANEPVKLRNRAKKTDAARWCKMHCGKGMRAPEITKKDGVTVSLVRRTLRKYREEKWGAG